MKKLITLCTLLLCAVVTSWGQTATTTIDFGKSYEDLITITFSNDSKTAGSLVNATLGGSDTKAYQSIYSAKGLSTSFTTKTTYNDISKISLFVSSSDKGKTFLTVEVSPKADFSSEVTTVQAKAVLNGGGLPTNVSNNNQFYEEVYSLSPAVSGYVRVTVTENESSSGKTINVGNISITYPSASEAFSVAFDAGSNGTCATASLDEDTPAAGVTLPSVTPNQGYVFMGWYTAAAEGSKVGEAGDTYHPAEDVTLYAQYVAEAAPSIDVDNYSPSAILGVSILFTASATGAPTPTVTWYQSETPTTSGGTEKGSGLTYSPDVSSEGTFYYYAVASNGVSPNAISGLITLTVASPDKVVSGNEYFISKDEIPVPDENIFCDDITMTFVNGKAGESFTAGVEDGALSPVDAKYVASITGSSSNNGWKAKFVPTATGKLSVGVNINKDKTFSVSNVTYFKYKTSSGTVLVDGASLKPNEKIYAEVILYVIAGKEYDLSVAGSKMGFLGFKFEPVETVDATISESGFSTYSTNYPVDLSTITNGTAYIATDAADGKVTLTKCETKVPAATGLLIAGKAGKTFTINTTADATEAPDGNLLVGLPNGGTVPAGKYVFAWPNDDVTAASFYVLNSVQEIGSFKAYLDTAAVGGARLSLSFGEDAGEATGISEMKSQKADGTIFNLRGQRVAQPQKGLYIMNGKKTIVK